MRLPLLALCALAVPLAHAASGGPDSGDLVWTDSAEPGGPSHAWLDGADTTYALGDTGTTTLSPPFTLSLYGVDYTSVTASADGWLAFSGTGSTACPTAGTPQVSVLAADLKNVTLSTATYGAWPARTWVVSWTGIQRGSAPGTARVQAWFLEGRPELVLVLDDLDVGDSALDGGAGASIGVSGTSAATAYACSGGVASATSVWFGDQGSRPGRPDVYPTELDAPLIGDTTFGYPGRVLATGDANGDGIADLLIGNQDQDQAFLVYRPSAIDTLADADAHVTDGDKLGSAVLLADTDGDGLDDVYIGETTDSISSKVAVLGFSLPYGELGAADADLFLNNGSTGSLPPGVTLAGGDVDGDGYADLLVGDPLIGSGAGRVSMIPGGSTPTWGAAIATAATAWFDGGTTSDRAGTALLAEDLDADGAAEIIIGLPYRDAGASDGGAVVVLPGGTWTGSNAIFSSYTTNITGNATGARVGTSLTAGDYDGDGELELATGAPTADPSPSDAGSVFLFAHPVGLGDVGTAAAYGQVNGVSLAANLGSTLASADLDGDGIDDLLAGAPNAAGDVAGGGAACVWRSGGSGTPTGTVSADDADVTLHGTDSGGALTTALVVSNEASPTVFASAPYASYAATGDGAIYAWNYRSDFLDDDGDGFVSAAAGGNDCDDDDAGSFPGGTDVADDDLDGDCDGWFDGELTFRTDADGWAWDLAEYGVTASEDLYDFEAYAEGDPIGTDGDLTWSGASVTATDDVSGSAAIGTRALQVTGGALNLDLSMPADALSLWLLDADDTFTLEAWNGTTLVASHRLDADSNDRPGGTYLGFVFASEVDFIRITADTTDTFGVDDVTPAWGVDSDRDLDGYTDGEGDCDDTTVDVSPGAPEVLLNGIDDDCDGVVDGGSVTVYTSSSLWTAPDPATVIDFEDRVVAETLSTQYHDDGVDFGSKFTTASVVDGTAVSGTLGARATSGSVTISFQEVQPSLGFTLLDADPLCTITGSAGGYTLYTAMVVGSHGSQFVGLEFGYGVTELTIGCGSDTFGIDDLTLAQVGLEDNDGDGFTEREGDCDDTDADAYTGAPETWYDGVDADCAGDDDFDADHDGYTLGADCVDDDATINPDAEETWYDGIDEDCSGGSDYDFDGDGYDGIAWGGEDCDDLEPSTSPDSTETWYDGVDSNCDGANDFDADGDGYPSGAFGGTDCDDLAAGTYPGAPETWYDGIDEDCAGVERGDYDQDGDGHDAYLHGGDDCDDTRADVYPDAPGDICYDEIDTNCDDADDFDCDGDGHRWSSYGGDDCDDTDASISPDATDDPTDGIDSNCDGRAEFDYDGDGFDDLALGGEDCNDSDAAIHPGALDTCYDGVDTDCDGVDDYDCDADGDRSIDYGGDDCDDADPTRSSLRADYPYDGVDDNCDGAAEYDLDGDGHDVDWYGGDDCDDTRADVHPGAVDACYDGLDADCGGEDDEDCDGDGVPVDLDCDDGDAAVYPGAPEVMGDGVDQDCDGGDLSVCTDCDGDGYVSPEDCNDADPAVNPESDDTPYDGVDANCDGANEYDVDGDGYDAEAAGGGDCDDADATVNPAAKLDACGRGDEDCDGTTDEDCEDEVTDTDEPEDSGYSGDTDLPDGRDTESQEERPDPAEVDDATKVEDKNACGCAATPTGGSLLGLALVGLLIRRRR